MDYIEELVQRYPQLECCKKSIEVTCAVLSRALETGGKLLIAGNGGSAADAEHMSGELLKGFTKTRPVDAAFAQRLHEVCKDLAAEHAATDGSSFDPAADADYLSSRLQQALPVLSLTNHSSVITACLNDSDGNLIFAQQIMGLGEKGDVFFGISTSGNSKNVVYALEAAKARGLTTITLTGRDGGAAAKIADIAIIVPEQETWKIQELHLPVYHAICQEMEDYFYTV